MKISRELVGGLSHLGRRKKDHAATMTRTPTRRRTGTKGTLTKKICQECGKAEDASKHIRYSNDLDNPVKHAFVPEVEIPKMGSLWWVARERHSLVSNFYVASKLLLTRSPFKDSRVNEEVYWRDAQDRRRICNDDFWHRAGGPRLKPGGGPVRIWITPGWWERV